MIKTDLGWFGLMVVDLGVSRRGCFVPVRVLAVSGLMWRPWPRVIWAFS
jgi:hypothetical protein